LRCWFFPVWLVSSPTRQKRLNIATLDWPKAEPTRCALIEFDDRVALEKHHAGDTFIVTALKDEERRRISLTRALDAARQADAQILVLPELSIAPALLDTLCDWLLGQVDHPFRLIVAGSYHHRKEGDPLAWNRMPVLDRCGEVLLHHDKWFEFDRDENRHERIHPGNTLHLLGTPVGWLSFAICKDFCHADGFDWKTLALDGVCVASMGTEKTLSAHDAMARNEKLVATRVLLANNTPESCGSQRGFYSLPGEAPQPNQNTVTVWEWDKPELPARGKPQLKIIK
jgi:hypothetical protein